MFSDLLFNRLMMTIDEIRIKNLKQLISDNGSAAALGRKIGVSDSQITQWKNAYPEAKTKKPRGISDDMCRHIENACEKPRGWLDNINLSDDEAQLLALYEKANADGREWILDNATRVNANLLASSGSN